MVVIGNTIIVPMEDGHKPGKAWSRAAAMKARLGTLGEP
jgi:hypothetical protein